MTTHREAAAHSGAERVVLTLFRGSALLCACLAGCGGGGDRDNAGGAGSVAVVDSSFNFKKSAFNGDVFAITSAIDGALQARFKTGEGFNASIRCLAEATDGSGDIFAGGAFSEYDGNPAQRLIRLDANGVAVSSFTARFRSLDVVQAIAPARDGSGDIYVAGRFQSYAGSPANYIVRLEADGSHDAAFDIGSGFDSSVNSIVVVQDGSGDIYVGGAFESYNGVPTGRIIRLDSTGQRVATFDTGTGFGGAVNSIATTADGTGDVYVGGPFADYNGIPSSNLIRLNSNGSRDPQFDVGSGFQSSVITVALATDGSGDILAGGQFVTFNGVSANRIIRLAADGTRDTAFSVGTGFDNDVQMIVPTTDGANDFVVVGRFTSLNGVSVNRIVRLESDGSIDPSFAFGSGFDGVAHSILQLPEGDVVVGGLFSEYDGENAINVARLVTLRTYVGGGFTNIHGEVGSNRLTAVDALGGIDTGFDVETGFDGSVLALARATDGSRDLYVGGAFNTYRGVSSNFIARLHSDGSRDSSFAIGSGFDLDVASLAAATDGSTDVYVGGYFTRYDGATMNFVARLEADGTLDSGFNVGAGFDGPVLAIAPATDGSGDVYCGGNFSSYNGTAMSRIARLNADGSLDLSFAVGVGFNDSVSALTVARDGSGDVYVGGDFTGYRGVPINRVVRLNADGFRDGAFNIGSGFDAPVRSISVGPSGFVHVGGTFSEYNGNPASYIARLEPDGMFDTGFNVGSGFDGRIFAVSESLTGSGTLHVGGAFTRYDGAPSNAVAALATNGELAVGFGLGVGLDQSVYAVASAPDGSSKIYAGGRFTEFNGTIATRIVRLTEEGAVDPTFDVGAGLNGRPDVIVVANDGTGHVYVGGFFSTLDTASANNIARLDADGSLDSTFAIGSGFDSGVQALAVAADGSGDVYVGGVFTSYNGTFSDKIIRLNADGTVDAGFAVGAGFDNDVVALAVATDGTGDVYVGGEFTSYDGVASRYIVRLNADGTLDTTFAIGAGFDDKVEVIAVARDGSGDVYVGGNFSSYNLASAGGIVRINADGTRDAGFSDGGGFDLCASTIDLALDGSGDLYVGGQFTSYGGLGANRIVRLAADGSRDLAFQLANGFDDMVRSIAIARDGSGEVLVGGDFTTYAGTQVDFIAALNPDGSLD